MFIVIFKAKGALNIETKHFGPFTDYEDAMDCVQSLPCVADCEHKFITELALPEYDNDGKVILTA